VKVYLDNAATTPLDAEVLAAMLPYFSAKFGNPSSLHTYGREAMSGIDKARDFIAGAFGANPHEVYFTSGGTESNNWAIRGVAHAKKDLGNHIISTKIEHPAVLEPLKELEKEGFRVTYLGVDKDGLIDLDELAREITEQTILITVMYANNEVGSVQNIAEVGRIAKERKVLLHTDAVQAAGSIKIDVKVQNIDLMSVSAHKLHGPKGVGFLYCRGGIKLAKLISGGHQERKQRGGTLNTPLIVGMAKALEITLRDMDANNKKIAELRDYLVGKIEAEIPFCRLNGGMKSRLVGNANFSFDYIEGESLLMMLDMAGVAVSSGSACASGSLEPSHVVLALGCTLPQAHSSIRFSVGRDNTKAEADYVAEKLRESVDRLREWSPLFKQTKTEEHYV
jgi:cysteine desulfurase